MALRQRSAKHSSKTSFLMMLMLAVSLPALGEEVRLKCELDFHSSEPNESLIMAFDEAKGTQSRGIPNVRWFVFEVNKRYPKNAYFDDEHEYFITKEAFGWRTYPPTGRRPYVVSVSRIDGHFSSSRTDTTGTCMPFK